MIAYGAAVFALVSLFVAAVAVCVRKMKKKTKDKGQKEKSREEKSKRRKKMKRVKTKKTFYFRSDSSF